MSRSKRRWWPLALAFGLMAVMVPSPAYASGYITDEAPLIAFNDAAPDRSRVRAIVSSGETVDGVTFQGIPDGVGLRPGPERGTVDVYVAHEETTVPFFGSADFQDASVTKWTLSTRGGSRGYIQGSDVAISSDLGYLRFCSASMAGPAEGFDSYVFFTGEESNDVVDVTPGAPYGADPALDGQRQAGYAVALNTNTGESVHIPGMGRLNHENTIALPGYGRIVLVTTDDTFSGPSAQLYMYLARDEDAVFEDRGHLMAFRVTATQHGAVDANDAFNGANDYLDLRPGDDFQGEFIRVPDAVADGSLSDIGPQDGLEQWSNDRNVFQFIRLEDLAYDKNNPNVVYIADTGRSRVVPDPDTGRLVRGPSGTVGFADNGSVFRMEFDPNDPRKVVSLTVLAQGDDELQNAYVPMVSPDNLDTSVNSLMVQEDADDAQIWHHDLASGDWAAIATVTDPDGESSGIVDASYWFGPGSWLLTVQGHGTNVIEEVDAEGVLRKLESGQLLLMNVPGS